MFLLRSILPSTALGLVLGAGITSAFLSSSAPEAPARHRAAPARAAMHAGPKRPAQPQTLLALNFDQAPLLSVAEWLGEQTGTRFLVQRGIQNTPITMKSPEPVSKRSAMQAFRSALEMSGLEMFPRGRMMVIAPAPRVVRPPVPTLLQISQENISLFELARQVGSYQHKTVVFSNPAISEMTVSISGSGPISADQLEEAFRFVVESNGLTLQQNGTLYLVSPR